MFDLFKIGFINVTFVDLLDIILVTSIIYKLYVTIKGTIAAQVVFGFVIVLLLSIITQALNFKAIGWLLGIISDNWLIAFIILFQQEIRKFLVMVGRTPLMNIFVDKAEDRTSMADILTEAAFEMAQYQHGALIVIIKSTDIKGVVESGEEINSILNKNLLRSLFFPRSPMHDGAVVVKNGVIEAARCTLPLSQKTSYNGIGLGMRHRAGLGITEQTDVISLIVSEETGSISLAEQGKLIRGLSKETLKNLLTFSLSAGEVKGWRGLLYHLRNKKNKK